MLQYHVCCCFTKSNSDGTTRRLHPQPIFWNGNDLQRSNMLHRRGAVVAKFLKTSQNGEWNQQVNSGCLRKCSKYVPLYIHTNFVQQEKCIAFNNCINCRIWFLRRSLVVHHMKQVCVWFAQNLYSLLSYSWILQEGSHAELLLQSISEGHLFEDKL